MDQSMTSDERNWAMWAHLCGLLWIVGGTGLLFLPFGGLALFSILGPLTSSLSNLLLALEVVVNDLLALVQEIVDDLLNGLSSGLAGLTL